MTKKCICAALTEPECDCGAVDYGNREWAGLTDEEILAECESVPDYDIGNRDLIHFAQAIEVKLKEKNT
jgi:hypothetical protein